MINNIFSELSRSSQIHSGSLQPIIDNGIGVLVKNNHVDVANLWLSSGINDVFDCIAEITTDSQHQRKSLDKSIFPWTCIDCLNKGDSISKCIIEHWYIQDSDSPLCKELGGKFVICAPIFVHGKVEGFISVCNYHSPFTNIKELAIVINELTLFSSGAILANTVLSKYSNTTDLQSEIEQVASIGGWEFDINTQRLFWTEEIYHIYGLSPEVKVTPEFANKFHPKEAQNIIKTKLLRAVKYFEAYDVELPFVDNNGQHKWIKTTGKPRISNGKVTHIYGVFEDITYQKQLLDTQEDMKVNTQIILDTLNDAIVTISEQGSILSANKAVYKIFGYRVEELVGKDISMLMPEPFASKHGQYLAQYLQAGQAGIIGVGRELLAIKKDGGTFPMELSISEMMRGGEKCFTGIVRDISERKKSEQYIQKLAYYDDLTGSFNRFSFDKELSKYFDLSGFVKNEISIFLINIDKFSQINLVHGEIIGDEILKSAVKRIKELLPPWTNVYRNNADNFFITFKHHEAISIDDRTVTNNVMADKLLSGLSSPFKVDGKSIMITVSIGLLDLTDIKIDKSNIKPLLELSVQKAKFHGGNQFAYAKSHEHAYLKRHSELTMALKDSHFIKEVSLVVQPQYDVFGNIVGSEALVRWNSPSFGFVSPAEFIPLAEQNGKIVDIGNWVIEQVCLLVAQRRLFTTEYNPVSINVSTKQIAQPSFSKYLVDTLTKHKIPPSEVVIELTESTLIADFDLVINIMTNLRGFNFSVDDFGTGYSSLSYLQKLPISELKIDKSFIDDIKHASDHVPIVNSIIQMAQELDLKIVAEGVETTEQLKYLEQHGCKIIQGYLFSKPLSVEQWLKQFCAE